MRLPVDAKDTQEPNMLSGEALDPKLAETYEIIDLIGRGGMGSVYKARHRVLGQYVAIKRIKGEGIDPTSHLRFVNEAKAASRLKHKNLLGLREFGIDSDGLPFAIMDFAEGDSLSSLIKNPAFQDDIDTILQIGIDVAEGLAHAHEQGVLHRDIKPSNIMVSQSQGRVHATIVDFGIAKLTSEEGNRLTQTGEVFGSPYYLSPEQALGQRVDHRCDLYSLGVVLYECVCGRPPFVGENPVQTAVKHLNEEVVPPSKFRDKPLDPGLEQIILMCLAKDPEHRFSDAQALSLALQAVHSGKGDLKLKTHVSKKKKKTWWLIGAVIGLLLTSSMIVCSLMLSSSADEDEVGEAINITKPPKCPRSIAVVEGGTYQGLPLTEVGKAALMQDSTRTLELFSQRNFAQAIFALRNTILILDDEIKHTNQLARSSESKQSRTFYRYAIHRLKYLRTENEIYIGQCLMGMNKNDEAVPYFEKALKFYKAEAAKGVLFLAPAEFCCRLYHDLLRQMNNPAKAAEIEAELAKMQASVRRE